ncbi:MAG: DNA polymerase/3'-5' exonuclease PolX [Candidatus Harrisonbacteria bacterium]|nr:DNA polymerase/3'-5' exonuclease PolX [Candidatus Harrisonbacteria bacterium]
MTNQEIAHILREIGEYLDMQGVPFKPRAYEKVAEAVEALEEPVADVYKMGGLKAVEDIPGVGLSIAEKIEELLKTGKLKYYEELKKKTPVNLSELTRVEGLGPRKIRALYQKLGVTNLRELELAAAHGKIKTLEGFGEKSEQNILQSIRFLKSFGGRFLLGAALPLARVIVARLQSLKQVKRLEIAGSVRRRKETIGDVDILIISDKPKPVMDAFVAMPDVAAVVAHGETKSAVKMKNGLDVDLRVVPEDSYGAALNYFTGSKDHNIALRQLAIKKGYKLNEYGLFSAGGGRGERQIAGKTEEEIYEALGLTYIEPEMREMTGEIAAALRQAHGKENGLPKLIGYGDIIGDLQTQTNWTDGGDSIQAMAEAAIAAGLHYIAITDHTKRLAMTNGLDEKRIVKQMEEIDKVNKKFQISNFVPSGHLPAGDKFQILKGTECDILEDGSMDLPDEILEQLDVVGASVHSLFNLPKKKQTERIIRAMENPNVDILFHPTGRLIGKRPPYEVDMDAIIVAAKDTGTVLEIDAFPDRLDLKDEYIRKCVEAGVKLCIDSDAHSATHFHVLEYGIAQARRGWATKKDIINAWPAEQMLGMLKDVKVKRKA